MSWPFASGGQSIGASASTSVLPKNIQDWSPLGLTGLISLQSKGLSRVFSSTTIQKQGKAICTMQFQATFKIDQVEFFFFCLIPTHEIKNTSFFWFKCFVPVSSVWTAITNYHKLGAYKQQNFFSWFGRLKSLWSRHLHGWVLLRFLFQL